MRLACKILLALVLAAPVEAQRMPIRRGILQSDLDGNQYSITNLAGMDAQNVTVWGRLVVNEFEGLQAGREGRIVNVLDYGAEPGPCRPWDDSYNGQDLLPADEAVAAAIAAAKGQSNTVYFPPGIYRFTNDVIYVPAHVNILGAGHFFNQGYGQPNLTNGYTLLWFNNLNSKGLWFTEMGKGNAFAMNFSICGWSGGPVPYAGEQGLLETVDHATFARIGLQVTDTNQSWCGGFFGRNVTVSGFRVGVRCDAGQSVFENCGWGGNVVGFASLGRGDFQQGVKEWYNDPNLNYYWDHALQFIPPAGGWGHAQPDDLALRHCFGGRRRHGLVHFFGAARRISITHDTSFDYCRWGMFSDTSFSVNDTYNEFAFSSAIASTNVITLFGTCNLAMRNTHFIHDAALNNHLNMYGEDMRNVALIEDRGFGSAIILQNVRFYPKSMYESDGYWPVLIKSHFQVKTEVEASGGTWGLFQTMGLGSRRVDYIPMGGRFNPWRMFNVQLYGGQPDPNGPTNFYGRMVPYGTLYAQGGRPDYLAFVTRSNSVGEAAANTNNLYWTRLLQSDPGPLRQRDGVWELPQNYTVDQLTVREGLVGNGAGLTNIPQAGVFALTNSLTWLSNNATFINVLDYGAVPGPCRPYNNNYDGSDLTNCTAAIIQAIRAANSATNPAIVFFPPGIYLITNTISVAGNVHLVGSGRFFNQGYSSPHINVERYTLIWCPWREYADYLWDEGEQEWYWYYWTNRGPAFTFSDLHYNSASLRNMSICGWTNGPVPYAGELGKLETCPVGELNDIGVWVGGFWSGGFLAEDVSVSGFKIGFTGPGGQSRYINVGAAGNIIGFAFAGSGLATVVTNVADPVLWWYWTNGLSRASQSQYADLLYFEKCFGGRRRMGMPYFFHSVRHIHIFQDTSFDYARWLMAINSQVTVENTYNESSFSTAIGTTNLIKLFGVPRLSVIGSTFLAPNPTGGALNLYGESMTNFAFIECVPYNGGAKIVLQDVKVETGYYPTELSAGYCPVLVKTPRDADVEVLTLGLTWGAAELTGFPVRRFDLLRRNSSWNPLKMFNTSLSGGAPSGNSFTNVSYRPWDIPYGQMIVQPGHPDYISYLTRRSGLYDSGAQTNPAPVVGANYYWTRLLQSDPAPLQRIDGNSDNWEIPQNYTLDRLLVRTNLIGNGAGLTNIPMHGVVGLTNSMAYLSNNIGVGGGGNYSTNADGSATFGNVQTNIFNNAIYDPTNPNIRFGLSLLNTNTSNPHTFLRFQAGGTKAYQSLNGAGDFNFVTPGTFGVIATNNYNGDGTIQLLVSESGVRMQGEVIELTPTGTDAAVYIGAAGKGTEIRNLAGTGHRLVHVNEYGQLAATIPTNNIGGGGGGPLPDNVLTNNWDGPPITLDAANAKTNIYGGSLTILGERVMIGDSANVADGPYSVALGGSAQAHGHSSFAAGWASYATGDRAFAMGTGVFAEMEESIALGSGAYAAHENTFVWSDGYGGDFMSTTNNQFSAQAIGGFNLIGGPIHGDGGGLTNLNLVSSNGYVLPQRDTLPTNSIPPSSAGTTNWVLMNLGPDYQGGGVFLVATNIAQANAMHVLPVARAQRTFDLHGPPWGGYAWNSSVPIGFPNWNSDAKVVSLHHGGLTYRWDLPLDSVYSAVTGVVSEITVLVTNVATTNYGVSVAVHWWTNGTASYRHVLNWPYVTQTTNGPNVLTVRVTNQCEGIPRYLHYYIQNWSSSSDRSLWLVPPIRITYLP